MKCAQRNLLLYNYVHHRRLLLSPSAADDDDGDGNDTTIIMEFPFPRGSEKKRKKYIRRLFNEKFKIIQWPKLT